MKIQVCSDLHLERADFDLHNGGADVLVLSGDILGAKFLEDRTRYELTDSVLFNRFRNFFDKVSTRFQYVVYVSGNHEFYGYKWVKTHKTIEDFIAHYSNVFYLEQDFVDLLDVRFVGGVLWTDLNKHDPITIHCISSYMNDYKCIVNDQKGFTKLKPVTTAQHHKETLNKFKSYIENRSKVVVCTHHAPSPLSIDEVYKDQTLMNGAYFSDLSDFMLDNPQIKLWTHGHMHSPSDYKIGETRVVCNPRGYLGYEPRAYSYTGCESIIEI